MEVKLEADERYTVPHFYTMNWFALSDMMKQLIGFSEEKKKPPEWLTKNVVPLYRRLKTSWEADGDLEVFELVLRANCFESITNLLLLR